MAKKRTKKRETTKNRSVNRIPPLPTLVTLGNLVCGFVSILFSIKAFSLWHNADTFTPESIQAYKYAAWLIFGGMIFDLLDGRIARMTKETSDFGVQIDSLADMITFGLAPAVLVKTLVSGQNLSSIDSLEWILTAVFVCCAALRLARYNVETDKTAKEYFYGLPTPAAAGTIASVVILCFHYYDAFPHATKIVFQIMPAVMLALGALMVSRVRYLHLGNKLLRGHKSFAHVTVLIFIATLFIYKLHLMLAITYCSFMLFGLGNEVFLFFKKTAPESKQDTNQSSDEKLSEASSGVPK